MSSSPFALTAQGIPSFPASVRSTHQSLTFLPSLCRFSLRRFTRILILSQKKAKNGDGEVSHTGELHEFTVDIKGVEKEAGNQNGKFFSTKGLMHSLKTYGVAGVLSYGLLNTFYYLTTFLLVWFWFAPAAGKMGYAAAVERFLKVMAMVWAGSQITKIIRAGGAVLMAPIVDRGLSWFTIKFKFESKGKAVAAIAGMCFGIALLLFFGLTLLWA